MSPQVFAVEDTARILKTVRLAAGAIGGKERQLANENFVSRAPADVIEKERTALTQLHAQKAATEAALAALRTAPR